MAPFRLSNHYGKTDKYLSRRSPHKDATSIVHSSTQNRNDSEKQLLPEAAEPLSRLETEMKSKSSRNSTSVKESDRIRTG